MVTTRPSCRNKSSIFLLIIAPPGGTKAGHAFLDGYGRVGHGPYHGETLTQRGLQAFYRNTGNHGTDQVPVRVQGLFHMGKHFAYLERLHGYDHKVRKTGGLPVVITHQDTFLFEVADRIDIPARDHDMARDGEATFNESFRDGFTQVSAANNGNFFIHVWCLDVRYKKATG